MTNAEKIEIGLIATLAGGLWLMAPLLPATVSAGRLLLTTSALLLIQGLARDLWLLSSRKAEPSPSRRARCLCVESAIGVLGVLAGLLLFGLGADHPLTLKHWHWAVLFVATMSSGFLIKDLVLEWKPLRIRRDKDHINIVVDWNH